MLDPPPALPCPHAATPPGRRLFHMRGPAGNELLCLCCALRNRRMLRRSFFTALVVGAILTLINQGPILFDGHAPTSLAWKIPLTFCVPFLVASWGALGNALLRRPRA